MIKKFLTVILFFSALFWVGCTDQTNLSPRAKDAPPSANNSQPSNATKGPLRIVTSFYPLYEIIHQLGGNDVILTNLVPAGAEPHDYEPTPQDIVNLNHADLVVYNGVGLEPWADKIIPDLQKSGVQTINISTLFQNEIIKNGPQTQKSEEEYLPYDPHLWMDPVRYQQEVQFLSQKLVALDPVHQSKYEHNTQKFLKQLQELDAAFQNGLQNCRQNKFVTNHAAFAYLSNRYHLTMIPIAGLSPDAEPSAKTMADLVNLIKQNNLHFILTETLVNPKIAETLADETGAKTLVLNPLEGLTDEEIAQGKNYVRVMQDNLKNLRTALECR